MINPELNLVSAEKATGAFEPRTLFALRAIRARQDAEMKKRAAEDLLTEYEELPMSKWHPAKKKRVKQWLDAHGFATKDIAITQLNDQIKYSGETITHHEHQLRSELAAFRRSIDKLEPSSKARLTSLLLEHNMPRDIILAYDESSMESIADWIGHSPSAQEPFGASDEQVAELIEWSFLKTEELANNPEEVNRLAHNYFSNIGERVVTGKLHPDWAKETARIDRVIVGDVFDLQYLGVLSEQEEVITTSYARYSAADRTIIIWPYEEENEGMFEHEMTHSMGGFTTTWVNEAFTERFTAVIRDKPGKEDIYRKEQSVIDSLMARVSDTEMSGCFVGPDHEENEQRARALFAEAYGGYDVLGTLTSLYKEIAPDTLHTFHPSHETARDVVLFAANEIIIPTMRYLEQGDVTVTKVVESLRSVAALSSDTQTQLIYNRSAELFASHV